VHCAKPSLSLGTNGAPCRSIGAGMYRKREVPHDDRTQVMVVEAGQKGRMLLAAEWALVIGELNQEWRASGCRQPRARHKRIPVILNRLGTRPRHIPAQHLAADWAVGLKEHQPRRYQDCNVRDCPEPVSHALNPLPPRHLMNHDTLEAVLVANNTKCGTLLRRKKAHCAWPIDDCHSLPATGKNGKARAGLSVLPKRLDPYVTIALGDEAGERGRTFRSPPSVVERGIKPALVRIQRCLQCTRLHAGNCAFIELATQATKLNSAPDGTSRDKRFNESRLRIPDPYEIARACYMELWAVSVDRRARFGFGSRFVEESRGTGKGTDPSDRLAGSETQDAQPDRVAKSTGTCRERHYAVLRNDKASVPESALNHERPSTGRKKGPALNEPTRSQKDMQLTAKSVRYKYGIIGDRHPSQWHRARPVPAPAARGSE